MSADLDFHALPGRVGHERHVVTCIFLRDGTPMGRIDALRADAISSTLDGMTISLGSHPAPVTDMLIPLMNEYLHTGARSRSMNFGIQPLATRNTTLFDLTKELDTATLGALLG